jgi:hypothetical protein
MNFASQIYPCLLWQILTNLKDWSKPIKRLRDQLQHHQAQDPLASLPPLTFTPSPDQLAFHSTLFVLNTAVNRLRTVDYNKIQLNVELLSIALYWMAEVSLIKTTSPFFS